MNVRARLAAVLATGTALVLLVLIVSGSGSGTHHLKAVFERTEQLAPGQELRIAGRKVGEIGHIELADGNAVVDLNITEPDVWPLTQGTRAAIRWGSTTSLAYRYAGLIPGPRDAPALPDGAVLTRRFTTTPVELDESYRIFRGRTRGDLKHLVGEVGTTLDGQGPTIARGLHAAPGGLDAAAELLGQLGTDRHALSTLASSGARVTGALAQRSTDLGALAENAAATFDEFARRTRAEQASLDRAPTAFRTATGTLGRLDTSLTGLRALVDDVAPGAVALRTLAAPVRDALVRLRSVAPLATSTLRTGTAASPGLQRLLTTGASFLPRAGTVVDQLQPMLACLRPYAPELAGMLANWTGYNRNYDVGGHYARTFPLLANAALIPGTPMDAEQVVKLLGGRITYAMPRPPGLNAGKPWFLPECGAGKDALDPSKDPEAGR